MSRSEGSQTCAVEALYCLAKDRRGDRTATTLSLAFPCWLSDTVRWLGLKSICDGFEGETDALDFEISTLLITIIPSRVNDKTVLPHPPPPHVCLAPSDPGLDGLDLLFVDQFCKETRILTLDYDVAFRR